MLGKISIMEAVQGFAGPVMVFIFYKKKLAAFSAAGAGNVFIA